MTPSILGIHHVTAIASDGQKNLDFYAGFLGLKFVKKTVNFDDPHTYHLYYGDEAGSPGSLMTFFIWPDAYKGRQGTSQAIVVSFAIAQQSLGYWIERCLEKRVKYVGPLQRFDETVLLISDPDGLSVELVAHSGSGGAGWKSIGVPSEHAIRRIHAVTLLEDGYEATADLLTKTLGYTLHKEENEVFRFQTGAGGPGTFVDVKCAPDLWKGVIGAGTIHHVAIRSPTDEQQNEWRHALSAAGMNVTPAIDRKYFHSVYFHEPGGVLLEIATDPPGMTVDEPAEELGTHLMLPSWYEARRQEIEEGLPELRVPQAS